jgi:hypothetical protein
MAASTIPSDAPLRQMLEHRRLVVGDRRLAHVLEVLRSRAGAQPTPPRSLMLAITGFSAERSELLRRLAEIESGSGAATDPGAPASG